MSIIICGAEKWEAEHLQAALADQPAVFVDELSQADGSDCEVLSNFVDVPVNADILSRFPKLKLIATRSTGYDHIDVAACKQRGVAVCNVPTYGENTVAEFAFALILALTRKLYPAIKRVREEGSFSCQGLGGMDLMGKTLGVVGTGHIGSHVVRMGRGFDMKVVAFDPHPNTELAQKLEFSYLSLEELLKQSDIITLHVPYLPTTHHLLNQKNLALCKRGSLLINTARGGLVETAGLVWALKQGILSGAGLDVLEEEGFVKEEVALLLSGHPSESELRVVLADHELMQMDNVLVTPHNAFNSKEAVIRILDTTAQNILAFLSGKPANLVG